MSARRAGSKPPLKFECTKCGKCCTRRSTYAYVYLNREEARALARFLGMSERELRRRYTFVDADGWTQLRFIGDACPFLDRLSGSCTVYAARPLQCHTFPFWTELIGKNGRWTEQARTLCEGVGQGREHRWKAVLASARAMDAWEED